MACAKIRFMEDNAPIPSREGLQAAPTHETLLARIVVYAVLVAVAYISVSYAYYVMLGQPMGKVILKIHESVIGGLAQKPIQYRILTYYIIEALHRLSGMAILRADLVVRFIFTAFALIFFQNYMRRWFDFPASIVGALIVGAILPVTYIDYIHQPHDVPNLLFTIIALGLIRDKKESWLILLIPIAMLNRESFIFVLWAWFFYNYDRLPVKTLILEFAFFGLLSLVVYMALPYYFGPRPNYVDTVQLANNLNPLMFRKWLGRLIAFIGPLTVAGCIGFKSKPKFLRRSVGFVIIYMVVNFVVGMYQETRLFLPVLPVIVPLGLATVFRANDPDMESERK